MKNAIYYFVLLWALVFTGFANAACYEDKDKFSGNLYFWCGAWGTGGKMLGGLNGLDSIPYYKEDKEGNQKWLIKLVSAQNDWSNITENDKLVFLIDNNLEELKINDNPSKNVDSTNEYKGVQAVEYVFITVTEELFNRIANAKKAEFALYTSKGRQERVLHDSARGHFGDLIKKVHEYNESK